MPRLSPRLTIICALLCNAFLAQAVLADDVVRTDLNHGKDHGVWLEFTDQHGFITRLPGTDPEALSDQIQAVRTDLIQHKQALMEEVAERELDTGDIILTALMPGGLIYAGYRKAAYEQAKDELAEVSADIDEFSRDLLAFQIGHRAIVVAQGN